MKILTTAAHTPYLYLLSKTEDEYYVIGDWNEKQRPKPLNVFIVSKEKGLDLIENKKIDIFLAHNQFTEVGYIFTARIKRIPTILVFHGKKQRAGFSGSKFYSFVKNAYVNTITRMIGMSGTRFVFIQPSVKWSYGFSGNVIEPGIDIGEMFQWHPELSEKQILIVGNNLHRHYFAHEYIDYLLNKTMYKVQIIGENKFYKSRESNNFEELKRIYSTSYVYLNLLKEPECGYNLSLLEAMATGMPVITLYHPESPIRHKYNGLVFSNKNELDRCLEILFSDEKLSRELGNNARRTVSIFFNIETFINNWKRIFDDTLKTHFTSEVV